MENLGIASVAAITVICYLVGLGVKLTPFDNNNLIPVVCGTVGALLGALACISAYLSSRPPTS